MNENEPMTHTPDGPGGADPGREVARTFQRRADDLHAAPFTLDDVRGRARTLRRRRRTAVAGAVLAVAATVTPVALLADLGDGPRRTVEPATAPEPVPYLLAGELVRGDAAPLPLEVRGTADGLAVLADGRVVVSSYGARHRTATVVGTDGRPEASYPLRGWVAGTADGEAAAWLTPDGLPVLVRSGEAPRELAEPGAAALAAAAVRCDEEGCSVLASPHGEGARGVWEVDDAGSARELPALTSVADASPDGRRVVDLSEVVDTSACAALVDAQGPAGANAWRVCEHNDYAFSPDGEHLSAVHGEGWGPGYVALLDAATGEELVRFDEADVYLDRTWEDASHVVALARQDDAWVLQRLGLDGTVEQVAGPFPGDDVSAPVVLPDR